jgi:hypothetical protein
MIYYARIDINNEYSTEKFIQSQFNNWEDAFQFLNKNIKGINYKYAGIHTEYGNIITSLRIIQ